MVQVIDASVAIKWFIEEEGREKALVIFEDFLNHPTQFAVPELFYFELTHVLYEICGELTSEQKEIFSFLLNAGIRRYPLNAELVESVVSFQKIGLSGYDAAYIALAKALSGKWLTFDGKAHRKIAHFKLSEFLG